MKNILIGMLLTALVGQLAYSAGGLRLIAMTLTELSSFTLQNGEIAYDDSTDKLNVQTSTGLKEITTGDHTPQEKVAVLRESKAGDGGTASSGSWITRDLNDDSHGDTTFVTLDQTTHEFTLQPGKYHITTKAVGYSILDHQGRLFNVSTSTVVAYGTNAYSKAAAGFSYSFVDAVFTISTPSLFRLEHRFQDTGIGNGLGKVNSFSSSPNIYSTVTIRKIQ
jgi:hypothetical protein